MQEYILTFLDVTLWYSYNKRKNKLKLQSLLNLVYGIDIPLPFPKLNSSKIMFKETEKEVITHRDNYLYGGTEFFL